MKWLSIWWYQYLFTKCNSDSNFFRTVICRIRNHPCGVWWYNPNDQEPNMHCKNCGDDLG